MFYPIITNLKNEIRKLNLTESEKELLNEIPTKEIAERLQNSVKVRIDKEESEKEKIIAEIIFKKTANILIAPNVFNSLTGFSKDYLTHTNQPYALERFLLYKCKNGMWGVITSSK